VKNTTPVKLDVLMAIAERHSVRAFLDMPVDKHLIETLLEHAGRAPSGKNTQPWHVDIVMGQSLHTLSDALLQARTTNMPANPDYQYYTQAQQEPYVSRAFACGMALYGALDIDRRDKAKRLAQWNLNYRFFGAPVGLIIHLDKNLATGSWMDLGMFIENILIGAVGLGLGTCPQASIAEYPDIVRQSLGISDAHSIACGIALGYPDESHPVNQYRTERLPLNGFTVWHD
jgi:nitroreductase